MSMDSAYIVVCDTCPYTIAVQADWAGEAKDRVKAMGWDVMMGRCYCPVCMGREFVNSEMKIWRNQDHQKNQRR